MVALVYIGNIEYCPYVQYYIHLLKKEHVNFNIYFWNRENNNIEYPENYYSFTLKSDLKKNKASKLLDFIRYRRWLRNQIKKHKEIKVVCLDTLSSILLYGNLRKNDYLLEIRDYSYENYAIFRIYENSIINNAKQVFISSCGFKTFLPDMKYVVCHNIAFDYRIKHNIIMKKNDVINIVWTGSIRYSRVQKYIIDSLANDIRFKIFYHGSGPDLQDLKSFCIDNGIENVEFTGKYNENEKISLLEKADFVLNAYDLNVGSEVKYALSNRFYDALMLKIPQIVEDESYKSTIIKEYNLGYVLKANTKKLGDEIFNYYNSFDLESFNESCNYLLNNYIEENEIYKNKILEFIREDL